jgi:cellulose biosynthesis protein BcsQ
MVDHPFGTIITFYSYKGGTGRSMALANVAWILAARGNRVLTIDWDFEAPGLHRYFRPFLIDRELASSPGLIDFFWAYTRQAMTPTIESGKGDASKGPDGPWGGPAAETPERDWWEKCTDLDPFTVRLDWDFPKGGFLDLISAGQQDHEYADRVNGFDWTKFYRRFDGELFLKEVRERVRREYDFVLIDSRTGVSDTAGICTVAMPDRLVAMFTLNRQSVDGVAAVLASVVPQRTTRPLAIFPVVTRVELAEKERLDAARKRTRPLFSAYISGLNGEPAQGYWSDMEVLYQPYYAYEEILAPFGDPSGDGRSTNSMLSAMERLATRVIGEDIVTPVVADEQRHQVLGQFAGTDRPAVPVSVGNDDGEQRRARALRYLEKDMGNPLHYLSKHVEQVYRRSRLNLAIVTLTMLAQPIIMALFFYGWHGSSSQFVIVTMVFSVVIIVLAGAEVAGCGLRAGPLTRASVRAAPVVAIVVFLAMQFMHFTSFMQHGGGTENQPLLGSIALAGLALIAQGASTIASYPARIAMDKAKKRSLETEIRSYTNGTEGYAKAADREAWQLFTRNVELIMDDRDY